MLDSALAAGVFQESLLQQKSQRKTSICNWAKSGWMPPEFIKCAERR